MECEAARPVKLKLHDYPLAFCESGQFGSQSGQSGPKPQLQLQQQWGVQEWSVQRVQGGRGHGGCCQAMRDPEGCATVLVVVRGDPPPPLG